MTRRFPSLLALLSVAALSASMAGCSLYFGDDDDNAADGGADDDVLPTTDAAPFPDASPVDARCETAADFLSRIGACMEFATWQATGMCDVPAQPLDTPAVTDCTGCHSNGEDGAFLSADCRLTFDTTRAQHVDALVRALDGADGCLTGFGDGLWLRTQNSATHPAFTFSEARATSIRNFFQFTFARYADPSIVCQ